MIGLILFPYLVYIVYESRPIAPENWKMYESLISIWPRLKREGIENIKFCWTYSPQTRSHPGLDIKGMLSFRIMDANVIKWWTHYSEVPKECLPECINILDKAMKGMKWKRLTASYSGLRSSKMLIVTKKGKYIVEASIRDSSIYSGIWESEKLKCELNLGANFIPPKEQLVSIVIFPYSQNPRGSRILDFDPIALFGDKKMTEKLFGRPIEPKMIFEGREELEKIIDDYNAALGERKQAARDVYCLIFVTKDWFYWKLICLDVNSVYDDCGMTSESLKKYFDELGLTKELLSSSEPY